VFAVLDAMKLLTIAIKFAIPIVKLSIIKLKLPCATAILSISIVKLFIAKLKLPRATMMLLMCVLLQ
jgi:hypothetical protein